MRDELISEVVQRMMPYLDNKQLEDLQIKALNRAIEETDDDQQKEDLRSIF